MSGCTRLKQAAQSRGVCSAAGSRRCQTWDTGGYCLGYALRSSAAACVAMATYTLPCRVVRHLQAHDGLRCKLASAAADRLPGQAAGSAEMQQAWHRAEHLMKAFRAAQSPASSRMPKVSSTAAIPSGVYEGSQVLNSFGKPSLRSWLNQNCKLGSSHLRPTAQPPARIITQMYAIHALFLMHPSARPHVLREAPRRRPSLAPEQQSCVRLQSSIIIDRHYSQGGEASSPPCWVVDEVTERVRVG